MKKSILIAIVVSLGGFLYGFDAGIISGVMNYVTPEFNLTKFQEGWIPSSPLFSAMFAMLIAGKLSDVVGRKSVLLAVAFLYALSAVLSAFSISYEMLYIARMIGGVAFGAALVIAPVYIAEISSAANRGKLVSVQQLNIVLGFFAAFLSNYYFNDTFSSGTSTFLTEDTIWRWMLGVELLPALLYFIGMFFVPKSPRWLFANDQKEQGLKALVSLYGEEKAALEAEAITKSLANSNSDEKIKFKEIFKPSLKIVLTIGVILGILQQITGINAIYYYATAIFKQTGIGTDASFASGILLSFTTVVFTVIAMFLIDKMGRRPLLLIGVGGIALSMLLCAYGFKNATYKITAATLTTLSPTDISNIEPLEDTVFTSDVAFKNAMKAALGDQVYAKHEGDILEAATRMNATLVLIGVLGFIACFAFSLGPVMWVMLSELFPTKYRGLMIGFVGFLNGLISWLVTQIFPWELATIGNAYTFLIYGVIAIVGFLILLKKLPETKGKTLEQIELDLVSK